MIPRRPRPYCAICQDRIATTITDWECESGATRTIVACFPCLSPVPDPPEEFEPTDLAERVSTRPAVQIGDRRDRTLQEAIMAEVRRRGTATSKELQEVFGMTSDTDRCALTKSLSRIVGRGFLAAAWVDDADHAQGRQFWPLADPLLAAIARMPDEFHTRDVDANESVARGLVRRWIDAGMIEAVSLSRERKVGGRSVRIPAVWRKTHRARRSA